MNQATPQQWEKFFLAHSQGFRKLNDKQAQARCPFHDDKVASMSINVIEGVWKCHGCGKEGNGLTFADLRGLRRESVPGWESRQADAKISTVYDYEDEAGKLLFQAVRYIPKSFRQRRPDGQGGWVWEINGTRRVLYRLPELFKSKDTESLVFVVEGEKDVETLRQYGFVSTCNPMGAGKWRDEYAQSLQYFLEAVVIADKDEPGRRHAQTVAQSVFGKIQRVKVLELPGERVKDATDYFDAGGTTKALMDLVQAAPLWIPAAQDVTAYSKESVSCAIIFNPIPAPQLLSQQQPERVWIWQNFIPQGGLVILCGAPKAGKSTLAYHLAKAVAIGEPFLGFQTQKCPVLILALEEHTLDVQNRIRELRMVNENVIVHVGPLKSRLAELDAIAKHIRERGIGFVIVDTLARFWAVKDENNASDAGANMEPILNLARASGAAVLLLHHLRKTPGDAGEDIRGSGDVFAIADAALTFRRRGDAKTHRVIKAFSRFNPPDELIISLENGVYAALGSGYQVKMEEQRHKMLSALTTDYREVKEIAQLAEIPAGTCRGVLNALFDEGLIDREGEGTRGKAYSYALKSENNCAERESLSSAQSNSLPEEQTSEAPLLAAVQQVFGGLVRP